jgi:2-phosphosulfolactate phosphatase
VRFLAPYVETVVIIDVLTFSSAVDVAVSRGAIVYPYRLRDASAAVFARQVGAALAVSREQQSVAQPYSLSPESLQALSPGDRLVLPSPNGATLSILAAEAGAAVIAGCLRNADAVAAILRERGGSVLLIAAGERWPGDDTVRPAIEDLLGAGAIAAALGAPRVSPDVAAAIAAFESSRACLADALAECSSGRELIERGFPADVSIAAALNDSLSVPLFVDDAFRGHST